MATKQDEDASTQNVNWQTRCLQVMEELQVMTKECEELKKKLVVLEKLQNQLATQNRQLRRKNRNPPAEDLSKPNKVSVEDIHDRTKDEDSNSQTSSSTSEQKEQVMTNEASQSLRQSLEQLTIDKNLEIKSLKKKLEEMKAFNCRLGTNNRDLFLENQELKEKTNEDNEDGRVVECEKRAEETENEDDSCYSEDKTQVEMFPSVFQSDSKPNFGFVNPFTCPASCVLSVIFFVFKKMNLRICSRKFPVQIHVDLNEISDVKLEVGPCNLMLEDLCLHGLIENVFLKNNINGIDQIDHALKEAIEKMAKPSYPALLAVQYAAKETGHCMAIMHKTDQLNPTICMEIYDVQKDKYWPKCDEHAKSINEIAVYSVVEAEAKRLKNTSGVNICKAECSVCILQQGVGPTNPADL